MTRPAQIVQTVVLALLLIVAGRPVPAQTPPAGTVQRPAGAASGTVIVPDRFLRSWDPVTIFFDADMINATGAAGQTRQDGSVAGVPEDAPERLVQLDPPHPGAFTWLDRRTLQMRPADPWPPLARFTWTAGGTTRVLSTLMEAPLTTIPADGATGLDPVETVTLVFAEPIDPEALARMVTIELRALPGVDRRSATWLTHEDFAVKQLERSTPSSEAGYVLELETPIPAGLRAIVHLRLSLEDDPTRSFTELAFSTAEPFRVVSAGSTSTRYPMTLEGSRYSADQAINAGSDRRTVVVELSARPRQISPIEARNLVRFTPAVENLSFATSGRLLEISGDFAWDTLYRVTLVPTPITDLNGRRLEMSSSGELHLFFPRRPAYLRWSAGQGVLERLGPRMVPVDGRGHERFDLRISPVDPLDRSFWPFPAEPVSIDEADRPPGPGETPAPFAEPRHIYEYELASHLRTLGTPAVSELVSLPLSSEGGAATFGLDLGRMLDKIGGERAPGHYLVGLRPLGSTTTRQWMRIQVTDLCLTAFEETDAVRLVVTSLASGQPVPGATISIQGPRFHSSGTDWAEVEHGTTSSDGSYTFGVRDCDDCSVLRLVVRKGDDVLVLDPTLPPDGYSDGTWSETYQTWLEWAFHTDIGRGTGPETVSHVFTERPVYRPEEPVYIKGYVRSRTEGHLRLLPLDHCFVVVDGPGELEWRFPVKLTPEGSFAHRFEADDRPTGRYAALLEARHPDGSTYRSNQVSFRLDAYRIPRFEVALHGPERAPLDRPFEVSLTATYYAGGRVADRPLTWRVTQFPYTWRPKGREGFFFSSDSRFSGTQRFEATAALTREDATDAEGSAVLELDPTLEATAQPRTYVVEATVVGADDQTVTDTRKVTALPPFVLGLAVPRYLEHADGLEPKVLAIGPDDAPLEGLEITVRLLQRQWHSYLRASDFSDGEARYVTEMVEEKAFETTVLSGSEPLAVPLPLASAGVWVVELEARDRIGRSQRVAVDLYAGGDEPVTWSKPTTRVFEVATDQTRYAPGETATFVLASPFQTAEALAVIEAPDGNRYQWLPVRGGTATFSLPVEGSWAPRLPVHFVLMRGRLEGSGPLPGSSTDLGKPTTLAATAWIKVEPRDSRLAVTLDHPASALPGRKIDVTIHLADPDGRPLPGEVTLWLVDQAVLALGREQPLDPLGDLITDRSSWLEVRDTRSLPFGHVPFAESPGGGEPSAEAGLLERVTVRRSFQPVPFYDPLIQVGPDGSTTVHVQLPDNLTNFKLRAKAVSGAERFGYATGHLEVRLPLIVQPALPRFMRPGDRFTAAAIGRVVEGEGGPGAAEARFEGVELLSEARQEVVWVPGQPQRIELEVAVPTPRYDAEGHLQSTEARLMVGVERLSDGASDAFEVVLPIVPDRGPELRRLLASLEPGTPFKLPAVATAARPGTVRRSLLLSSRPALVRMAAGLSFLMSYPHGCTEQRISRARARVALERFRDTLGMEAIDEMSSGSSGGPDPLERTVGDTVDWIAQTLDDADLVAYWPGSRGYVSLTAWSLELLVEARDAGFTVDTALTERLIRSLEQALRSDYSRFIDGESFAERCWALVALARAGRFNPAYAAELSRKARFLKAESVAEVLQSFVVSGLGTSEPREQLGQALLERVIFRLHQGREVYGGLQDGEQARSGLILPSETRALAEITRAVAAGPADQAQLEPLVDGLVRLGRGDGWGSTNANASALLALAAVLDRLPADSPPRSLEVELDGELRPVSLTAAQPTFALLSTSAGDGEVRLLAGDPGTAGSEVAARAETRWIPEAPGSEVAASPAGFVVSRELLVVPADEAVPPRRLALDSPGQTIALGVGEVVEDHVQVVNPADRFYVAVVVPLAAGMEPLNPALATAPPEARPTGRLSREPSYALYADDRVAFYYDQLPKGTLDLYFRTRATVPGRFIQPPAITELMYDGAVRGHGNGAWVEITPATADAE